MTYFVFWGVVLMSFAFIVLVILFPDLALLLILPLLLNIWSIIQSERGGFVRAKEMRRAVEPPRHFNGFHVLTIIALIIGEILLGTFLLVL